MSKKETRSYDILEEAAIVREQQQGDVDPIVEARNMISQSILTNVLLALSDCHFYEYLRDKGRFKVDDAAETLDVDATTLEHLMNYLTGCGAFTLEKDEFVPTEKGQRYFNAYTRGVLNIYPGAYKSVLTDLTDILSKKRPLDDPSFARSTRHAAEGTAYATCAFTIPKVLDTLQNHGVQCVLDLGCGTGDFLMQLLRLNPEISGIGVDMSGDALAQAKRNTKNFELEERLSFYQAEVGAQELPITKEQAQKVDFITAMYMLHEFGRDGREAIIKVIKSLQKQFKGKNLLAIEVEDFDAFNPGGGPLKHFGRLDYRLIHYLSRQGLPRTQEDWHGIFKESGCKIVEPGLRAGGSFIYIAEL